MKDLPGKLLFRACASARPLVGVLVATGILGFVFLPFAERNVFFDENALLIGSASVRIGPYVHVAFPKLHKVIRLFELRLRDFAHPRDLLLPLEPDLSTQTWQSDSTECTNVHIVSPSARGDGSEAVVLVTPISSGCSERNGTRSRPSGACWTDQDSAGAASALAIGAVLTKYLREVPWMSRGFVWLIPDARCGLVESVEMWLRAYQGADPSPQPQSMHDFEHAGALQQALVLVTQSGDWKEVEVATIGSHGLLPKLDLYMVAERYFRELGAGSVRLPQERFSLPFVTPSVRALAAALGVGSQAADAYSAKLEGVLGFVGLLAEDRATGPHAPFKHFGIDAVSIQTLKAPQAQGSEPSHKRIVASAAALEGAFRSLSNLMERLHHSYYMYLQPDTQTFITVDAYIVPPLLMIAALVLWAAHILLRPMLNPQASSCGHADATPQQVRSVRARFSTLSRLLRRNGVGKRVYRVGLTALTLELDVGTATLALCRVVALYATGTMFGLGLSRLHGCDRQTGSIPINVDGSKSEAEAPKVFLFALRATAGAGLAAALLPALVIKSRVVAASGKETPAKEAGSSVSKAILLLASSILFSGWLFVNWAQAYMGLLCLVPQLLAAGWRPPPHQPHAWLLYAGVWLQMMLASVFLHPWLLSGLLTGKVNIGIDCDCSMPGSRCICSWNLIESMRSFQNSAYSVHCGGWVSWAFLWVVYVPAWVGAVLVNLGCL